jgi:hypothetical protein
MDRKAKIEAREEDELALIPLLVGSSMKSTPSGRSSTRDPKNNKID